jgi:hypothetical protein
MNEVADSVIVVGDLNIHHASWLRFSNGETTRGRQLKDICDSFGLRQLISQPTRGEYLLDLCLSNSQSTQTEVKAKIADHACLLVKEPDAVEIRQFEPRHIWKLEEATGQRSKNICPTLIGIALARVLLIRPWTL